MSIEDRDWIRETEPKGFSFKGLPPLLTIISVTTFAFFVQSAVANGNPAGQSWIENHLALSLRGAKAGEIWQPLTYLLLHGSLGHIFWNMFTFWAFGTILRDLVADRGVWWNYVVGGLAGAGACLLWSAFVPAAAGDRVVGASGAITAVLVAAALRAPRAPIHLFLMPVPIPLWLLGTIYVAIDLVTAIQAWSRGVHGAVAVQAHLGGAAGAAILFLLARRSGGRPAAPRRSRRELVGDDERLAPPPPSTEPRDEARVDALLAKIHAWGMGSLSEEEKEFLKRASEKYRGRRK